MERIVLQRHFHNGILVRSIGLAALKFPTYRDTKQGSASSGSSVGVLVLVPDILTVREASILGDDAKEALFIYYLYQVFYVQYPFYLSRDGQDTMGAVERPFAKLSG